MKRKDRNARRQGGIGLAKPHRMLTPVPIRPWSAKVSLTPPGLPGWVPRYVREDKVATDEPTAPRPVGQRGDEPLDLVLVFDDSGSTESTDPNGFRYVAARRLVTLLAESLEGQKLGDRIGVVHFADAPQPWLPLTDLRRKQDRNVIRRTLRPLTGGGTMIVPAIDRAANLLSRTNRPCTVLLFTDGESEEGASELNRALSALPIGCLHVVTLGEELPEQWRGVPLGSVTTLQRLSSPDGLEWALARALYRSLGLAWPNGYAISGEGA